VPILKTSGIRAGKLRPLLGEVPENYAPLLNNLQFLPGRSIFKGKKIKNI
jgi:hypothetical protein